MNRKIFVILSLLLGWQSYAMCPDTTSTGKPLPSLAPMIKQVHPAVVNIATFSTQQYNYTNPLLDDPFFKHFFNLPDQRHSDSLPKKHQKSAGSGVIVDADKGVVMTNYHVIKGADEVEVALVDGRNIDAKVLGKDPDLDIAILQIDADNLVAVSIADVTQVKVGDFVVAIGNPFGLGQTVTTGVVSALGRTGLGIEGYENFIQTDASINPGNSGGALVNLAGELVGINTAIVAPSGGNVGIGFAIPSNMAQASMTQILEHGEVKRGQIGINIQDMTSDLRQAFKLNNGQGGVLVTHIVPHSPAESAGLKSGDVVIEVDGQETKSTGQLRTQIGMKSIGDSVTLTLLGDGDEKRKVTVTIGKISSFADTKGRFHGLLEGVQFESLSDGQGIQVTDIDPSSKASLSGLRLGDIIVGANRHPVVNVDSFEEALSRDTSSVLLQVNRQGGVLFVVIHD